MNYSSNSAAETVVSKANNEAIASKKREVELSWRQMAPKRISRALVRERVHRNPITNELIDLLKKEVNLGEKESLLRSLTNSGFNIYFVQYRSGSGDCVSNYSGQTLELTLGELEWARHYDAGRRIIVAENYRLVYRRNSFFRREVAEATYINEIISWSDGDIRPVRERYYEIYNSIHVLKSDGLEYTWGLNPYGKEYIYLLTVGDGYAVAEYSASYSGSGWEVRRVKTLQEALENYNKALASFCVKEATGRYVRRSCPFTDSDKESVVERLK